MIDEPNVTLPLRSCAPTPPLVAVIWKRRSTPPGTVVKATSHGSGGTPDPPGWYNPLLPHVRVSTRTPLMTTSSGASLMFKTRRDVSGAVRLWVGARLGVDEHPITRSATTNQSFLGTLARSDLK
jgi:hypothetical protein